MSEASQGDTEVGTSASEAPASGSPADKLFTSTEGQDKGAEDASKAADDKSAAPDDTGNTDDKTDDKAKDGDKPDGDKSDDKSDDKTDDKDSDAADTEFTREDLDYSVYPEGVELDDVSSEAFMGLAKEHSLSKAAVQELINLDAERTGRLMQEMNDQHQAQVDQWSADTRADKEIGGTKLDDSLATAAKAVDAFGKDLGLKELFNQTGLGDHPAIIKVFTRIGKAISEDQLLTGRESEQPKSAANVLYGENQK